MHRFDITLLTDSRYVAPQKLSPYIWNVLKEDQLLSSALEQRGMKVQRINWDKKQMKWADTRYILDNKDQLALAELELIEPELWFRLNPEAAEKMADALVSYCS